MSWQGNDAGYKSFVSRHKLTFPSGIDVDGTTFAKLGVPGQPAWVFFDSTGKMTRSLGVLSEKKLEDILSKLA